jgi:hypothetical protein
MKSEIFREYERYDSNKVATGSSKPRLHWRKDPTDKKMKIRKGQSMYHFISFLHEILFFFISSFLSFPLHIRRIVLCFVYSDDHQHSFIYPSLEEEGLHSACVVDVDHVSSPQPIEKNEVYISILLEHALSCNHVNDGIDSLSSQILSCE